MGKRGNIFNLIRAEQLRQVRLFGEQNHDDLKWNSILLEEAGEAAQCINKLSVEPVLLGNNLRILYTNKLKQELIQVAAVCATWLEALERRKDNA